MTMIGEEIDWINTLRRAELKPILAKLPWLAGDLLEIGGGSGQQAVKLSERGLRVWSIDLPSSTYREGRAFPIQDYNGRDIPFPPSRFDVIFSSNTLEHIPCLDEFEQEIHRVLRPSGRAVHVLPTHHWRLWTSLTHYPALLPKLMRRVRAGKKTNAEAASSKSSSIFRLSQMALFPPRHGERGNSLSEYGYFHPRWWVRHFEETGWRVIESFDLGLFYTGYMLMKANLPLARRQALARYIGSATRCYVLEKNPNR